MSSNETEITDLKTEIRDLKTWLERLENQYDRIEHKLSNIDNAIKGNAERGGIGMASRVSTSENEMQDLDKQIKELQNFRIKVIYYALGGSFVGSGLVWVIVELYTSLV